MDVFKINDDDDAWLFRDVFYWKVSVYITLHNIAYVVLLGLTQPITLEDDDEWVACSVEGQDMWHSQAAMKLAVM